MQLGVWPFVGLLRLLRGCVALEYGLVSIGLQYFLRLAHALYCRSGRLPLLLSPCNNNPKMKILHCWSTARLDNQKV